jgi:hypothetical protein
MTAQEEINQIIFQNKNITESWLADKLSITPQNLNYQLHMAKKFDNNLYKRIKLIFKKEGIILDPAEQCTQLSDRTLEFGALIGNQLSVMNNEVRKAVKNDNIEFNERVKLKIIFDDMRDNINQQLDELEKLIEG